MIVFFSRTLNRSLFVPDWPLLFSDLRHSRMLVWWVYRSAGRGQPSSLASLTAFSAGLSTRAQEENMEPDMRITRWKCDCRIIGLCTRYSTLAAPTPWGVRYYILQYSCTLWRRQETGIWIVRWIIDVIHAVYITRPLSHFIPVKEWENTINCLPAPGPSVWSALGRRQTARCYRPPTAGPPLGPSTRSWTGRRPLSSERDSCWEILE